MKTYASINRKKGGESMMIDPMFFAGLIGKLERGVGRDRVAQILGVKPPVVSQYKTGKVFPSDDRLARLGEVTGHSERYLLSYKYAIWLKTAKGLDPMDLASVSYPNVKITAN